VDATFTSHPAPPVTPHPSLPGSGSPMGLVTAFRWGLTAARIAWRASRGSVVTLSSIRLSAAPSASGGAPAAEHPDLRPHLECLRRRHRGLLERSSPTIRCSRRQHRHQGGPHSGPAEPPSTRSVSAAARRLRLDDPHAEPGSTTVLASICWTSRTPHRRLPAAGGARPASPRPSLSGRHSLRRAT